MKISLDLFLATFWRDLSRAISGYLYLSPVISTDFIYARARGQITVLCGANRMLIFRNRLALCGADA